MYASNICTLVFLLPLLKTAPFINFLFSITLHPEYSIHFTLQNHSAVIITKQKTFYQIIDSVIYRKNRNYVFKNTKLEFFLGVILVLKLWHSLPGMQLIQRLWEEGTVFLALPLAKIKVAQDGYQFHLFHLQTHGSVTQLF